MSTYEYTARNEKGEKVAGIYGDVDSISTLRDELVKLGYILVKARRKKDITKHRGKVKQGEVVTFAYKLAGMCSAGLSISRCLEATEEQTESDAFRYILADIRERIQTGSTLKDAFEKYRNIFSDFFLGMVETGETGGSLSKTLELSASYLENQAEIKHKVRSAFVYPIFVGVVCLFVVAYLVMFVVPVFSKLYRQMHATLPGPTQVLILLSNVTRDFWWAVLLVTAGFVLLFRYLSKKPYLKARWDVFKLNMPVFGKLNRMIAVSQFTRTFAMLASTGVTFVKALGVASRVAHNSRISEIADQLKQSIEAGNPVGSSLKEHDIFPPMLTQLAITGEEAGVLPDMLNKGVDLIDKDIDRTIKALLVKLEPTMTLIMGLIVLFILMGVYLPMFDYMSHLK